MTEAATGGSPRPVIGRVEVVSLAAALVLVACGALKWLDGDPGVTGYNVPAKFLVDVEVQQEGVSIGALLLLVGIVGALGAFVPQLRLLMVVAGAAAIAVVVAFVYQLGEFADLVNEDAFGTTGDVGRGDLIGFGVWVAGLAGGALLVAGLLSGRAKAGALPSGSDGS